MHITLFGKGNMGTAIGKNLEMAGNTVKYITHEEGETLDDVVILAVHYPALDDIVERYKDQLDGKIVVEITNPVNYETWDGLVVPSDTSAAEELHEKLPNSKIVKGFNTNLSATLVAGTVGGVTPVVVLLASDSEHAKETLETAFKKSPLIIKNAGSLKRARELEAMGFLQMALAANEEITWTGGFGIID